MDKIQKPGPMAPPKAQLPAIAWPAEINQLRIASYRLKYARKCRLCETQIEFWTTPNRKLIPLEKNANNLLIPHHSTCPKVAEFRKKKAEQGELFK